VGTRCTTRGKSKFSAVLVPGIRNVESHNIGNSLMSRSMGDT
jgi:hypothetical protein